MPTYTYKCNACGYVTELEREIDRRHDMVFAPHAPNNRGCDGSYKLIITPVSIPFETMRDKGVFERLN